MKYFYFNRKHDTTFPLKLVFLKKAPNTFRNIFFNHLFCMNGPWNIISFCYCTSPVTILHFTVSKASSAHLTNSHPVKGLLMQVLCSYSPWKIEQKYREVFWHWHFFSEALWVWQHGIVWGTQSGQVWWHPRCYQQQWWNQMCSKSLWSSSKIKDLDLIVSSSASIMQQFMK